MRFLGKKFRLLAFLLRRIPRHGWSQLTWGAHHRATAYLALDLAGILPSAAATIVDVGAHEGDMAEALDFLYHPSRLWLVEANPAKTELLRRRFAGRPHVTVVPKGLGEREGEAAFYVHEFDAASSLFSCRPGHLARFGFSEERRRLTVSLITLENLLERESAGIIDLLKLDCQGAELAVLKGAGPRLRDVRFVYCEVSFEPIYAGAPLFPEVHGFLRSAGFALRHLGEFAGAEGSVQWGDALYENTAPRSAAPG